jgi:DnaK suppressor protein
MARKKATKAGSDKLSAADLKQIKSDLLKKRDLLQRNISSELSEMTNSERHHLADMDDLGGDANDEETSFKILELESAELDQIEYALERLEKGDYGTCEGEDCEKPIGRERLAALPFASLCIDCKRVQEVSESDF